MLAAAVEAGQGGWAARVGRGGAASGRAAWAPALVADTDYVTALCSQVVYEGLVDDTFRIKCGKSPGEATGEHGALHPHRESSRVCAWHRQTQGLHAAAEAVPCRDSPAVGCCLTERLGGHCLSLLCSRADVCWDVPSAGAKQLFILLCRERGFWARRHLF